MSPFTPAQRNALIPKPFLTEFEFFWSYTICGGDRALSRKTCGAKKKGRKKLEKGLDAGLPDFSWHNLPKWENMYQITTT
jgi:hypothetical protein